eukprot:15473349-Alexandrium_andersonii.AAC.1
MHPLGASGTNLRPILGPPSFRFERLRRSCIFRRADCGLRRVAALAGRGRIVDFTLDTSRRKDPS